MTTVYTAALDSGLFAQKDIKVRMTPFVDFLPVPDATHFVFITIKVVSGRSVEMRRALSQRVFEAIQALGIPSLSVSVEIVEMLRDTYVKGLCNGINGVSPSMVS